jgi:hypothetical protein
MRRFLAAVLIAAIAYGLVPASAGATTNPADAAIVKAGLLTTTDFRPGWTQVPFPTPPAEPDVSRYGKTCAAIQKSWNAAKQISRTSGRSTRFERGTAWISDTVATFDTVADADASLAHLKARQFTACLQKYYNNHDKVSKNGVTYTNTSTNKRISVPSIGDTTLGFENEVTGSARGHSSTAYSEVEDVQVGRTVLSFNFTGGGPSLLTNQQALVQSVVNRVRRAASAT